MSPSQSASGIHTRGVTLLICRMTYLDVTEHTFHDYNIAFILIFAVLKAYTTYDEL